MFAGRVKLRTFLVVLAISAIGVAGVGLVGFVATGFGAAAIAVSQADGQRNQLVTPTSSSGSPDVGSTADAAGLEQQILSFVGRDLGSDKLKDAVPGATYKINAYQDVGNTTVNRLKIDLDRDEKWDQKVSFADGRVAREIAPADDENYTEKSMWNGSAWVSEGASAVHAADPSEASATESPTAALAGAREVDRVVLGYQGRDLGVDKLKDVTSGKPYKVNVYQDAGQPTANRAKIDLDRDDKWDEKLTFADGTVAREVAPADDENYTETWIWSPTGWNRK
jgi:hypothetical protein